MKLLLVSWSILPRAGGSSIVVENLAKNFEPWELVVLGGKGWLGKELQRPGTLPRFVYCPTEFHLFGRGHRYFNWLRKWRFKPLLEQIKSVIQSEKIDYVIGVFPDAFYCYAACLAAKSQQIPFSAYFHNTYLDNTEIKDPRAAAIQQEIFDYSEYIFVISKGMQQFYAARYQHLNIVPLVHTFYKLPDESIRKGIPGKNKEHYKLVAIGNFNESNMEATIRFARAIESDQRFSLSLYTHVPKWLLRKRGLNPRLIEHKGFGALDNVQQVLQEYDICVLTHGFSGGYGEIEYRTIFPTRTLPLLLSGKPMVVHAPPGSFLSEFIRENQCAELVDLPEAPAVIQGLERIIGDAGYQQKLVDAASRAAGQFYGPLVVEELRHQLNKKTK